MNREIHRHMKDVPRREKVCLKIVINAHAHIHALTIAFVAYAVPTVSIEAT